MTELLVGTKKGLFVLRATPARRSVRRRGSRVPRNVVSVRDPRSRRGRYFASVTSGHFGLA